MKVLILLFCLSTLVLAESPDYYFPDDFLFGAASASYQVEGAWDEDGKGESIWDHYLHESPNLVADGSNGDIACDSYHKYKEDVQLLKNMGAKIYRFSVSWPRILPNGKNDEINQAGIDYYNNLIDELLANGIEPYITMYHWDLPQPFQEEGGWPNRQLADYFVDYARVLFENFGDRVKHWMTFNEITSICVGGYGQGYHVPFITDSGVSDYECAHTILLAHARTYRLYDSEFRDTQNGKIGTAFDCSWEEPTNPDSASDVEAAEIAIQMTYGWFFNPIVYGNYPEIMIEKVANMSALEGYPQSRLPEFTQDEQEILKRSFDFLGINHYTSYMAYMGTWGEGDHPSRYTDMGVVTYLDPSWNGSASDWLKVVPWGIYKMLVWVKDEYGNPPVIITENGFSDTGELEDYGRINYYRGYLYEIARAINEDGCNVFGYTAWSLTDNFEWMDGFTKRFGLHYVDFDDPERPRTRKMSSYVYQNIIETKHVDWEYTPEWPPQK